MKTNKEVNDILAKKLARKDENVVTTNVAELNKLSNQLIKSEAGREKIAQMIRPFFKQKMDYQGFARQLAVVEDASDGMPLWYEKDYPDLPAIKAAENGSVGIVDLSVDRVVLSDDDEFELMSLPMIPLKTVFIRTFKTLDRLKVKTEYGLRIKEDLMFLALLDAATLLDAGNDVITSAGGFTKRLLNRAMSLIEQHRLKCHAVICGAKAIADLRSWQYEYTGPVMIQQILESGYAGQMYGGLDWYVTDQIAEGDVFIVTTPEYLAWIPFRTEVEVDPIYLKTENLIGFKAYILEAMLVHNPLGVAKIEFTVDTANIYA